jgi:hypothetical protein
MTELIGNFSHLPYWQAAQKTGTTNWNALFEGYQSAVDYPSALFYQDQMKQFPDAKVLLTVRDPERWYQSVLETIYDVSQRRNRFGLSILRWFVPDIRELYPRIVFINDLIWDGQFEGRFTDKDYAIAKYNEWNESVIATVPADKLLVFEVKQGWQPLELSTQDGKKFMRKISQNPGTYSRLDRMSRLSQGQKVVSQLIGDEGGDVMITYLATTNGGRNLGEMLAGTPDGTDLNLPTGRIYTADDLLGVLKKVYKKEFGTR